MLDLPVLVNTVGDMFINAVARNRGIGLYAVRNGFGEGRMVLAQDAVKAGTGSTIRDPAAPLGSWLATSNGLTHFGAIGGYPRPGIAGIVSLSNRSRAHG